MVVTKEKIERVANNYQRHLFNSGFEHETATITNIVPKYYENKLCAYLVHYSNKTVMLVSGTDAAPPILFVCQKFDSLAPVAPEHEIFIQQYLMQLSILISSESENATNVNKWGKYMGDNFEYSPTSGVSPLMLQFDGKSPQWGQDYTNDGHLPRL